MIARFLEALVRIASNILELLTLKARKKDKEERRQEAQEPAQAASEIRQAVAEGDQEKVNQLLEEARLERMHGVGKTVSAILLALTLAGSGVLFSGCVLVPKEKPLVLSADRQVVRMTMDGISGWFVPDAEFADLTAAYIAETRRMRLRESLELVE